MWRSCSKARTLDRELEQKMAMLGGKLGAPELVPESPCAEHAEPGGAVRRWEGYRAHQERRRSPAEWSTGAISVGERAACR